MAKSLRSFLWQSADMAMTPFALYANWNHMQKIGIGRGMRIAKFYNLAKYKENWKRRVREYRQNFDTLLSENGDIPEKPNEIVDGWALDTSQTLPHLERLLQDADEIIAERGRRKRNLTGYRSFLQELAEPGDLEKYPSLLDFITSSAILKTVCDHLGFIPCMPLVTPPGVRFVESWSRYDSDPEYYRDSQLFHLDYYYDPLFYVIVLLKDVTPENGPFSFLPQSISQRVCKSIHYREKGRAFRMPDDEIYKAADKDQVISLCYPRGTVLFIEPSACLHYGSRNAIEPRYQLMYAFSPPYRGDFRETISRRKRQGYPIREEDSPLRKMVLDKNFFG